MLGHGWLILHLPCDRGVTLHQSPPYLTSFARVLRRCEPAVTNCSNTAPPLLLPQVGSSEQDLVDLIVGAVAITLLATVLTVYTKKMLEELLAEQAAADTAVGGSGGGGSADSAGERRAGSGALTSAGDSYNDDDYSAASTEMRCGRSHLGSV